MSRKERFGPRIEKLRDVRHTDKPWSWRDDKMHRKPWNQMWRHRQNQLTRMACSLDDIWDFDIIEPKGTEGWLTW